MKFQKATKPPFRNFVLRVKMSNFGRRHIESNSVIVYTSTKMAAHILLFWFRFGYRKCHKDV